MGYKGEKAVQYQREWTAKNREKRRKYSREWKHKNRKKCDKNARDWIRRNPKKHRALRRKYHSKLTYRRKLIIFNHYCNNDIRCMCPGCKEIMFEFLTIDHINNDGSEQRGKKHPIGPNFYKWIIDNNFPDDLQILCWNCNIAKRTYGKCPHVP